MPTLAFYPKYISMRNVVHHNRCTISCNTSMNSFCVTLVIVMLIKRAHVFLLTQAPLWKNPSNLMFYLKRLLHIVMLELL